MKPPHDIYLDYAAATPMADFVMEAMLPYFTQQFYNPSSPYSPAVEVRHAYDAAKSRLAHSFGASADEIIMTAGATESINLAFAGVTGHVVTASIEHPAVLESAKKHPHTLVAPSQNGLVSPEAITAAITPETVMVSVALANNELGTIQPIRKIAAVLKQERELRVKNANTTPLLFHCDASQGFDQIDVHVARLGIDLLTLNSAKMYGPKQIGLLWIRRGITIAPLIVGGGQEHGARSGTENVAGVIGFAAAAEYARSHQRSINDRLATLRDTLQAALKTALPTAEVLGAQKHRLPGHLLMGFPNIDAERIIFLLESQGIYVSSGSACSANKHSASHVLIGIGCSKELINGSLRMTLGRHTTNSDIDTASSCIIEAVQSEYKRIGMSV